MKTRDLYRAVACAARVAGRATRGKPVGVGRVLVQGWPGTIGVRSYGGADVSVVATVSTAPYGTNAFEAVVEARQLAALLKQLGDRDLGGDVGFQTSDSGLRVEWIGGEAELLGAPVEEFPRPHEPLAAPLVMAFDPKVLGPALRRSLTAAVSEDDCRPRFCGIHMVPGDGQVQFQSSDGHRALDVSVAAYVYQPAGPMIVTRQFCTRLIELCQGTDPVELWANEGRIWAVAKTTWGSARLCGWLITDQFVNFTKVFGTGPNPVTVKVDAGQWNAALMQIETIATGMAEGYQKCKVEVSGGEASISVNSLKLGSMQVVIPALASGEYTGWFNPRYLRTLGRVAGDITLMLCPDTPGAYQYQNTTYVAMLSDEFGARAAVMPMQGDQR